ncbi:hypothetical protein GQ53DRAFT_753276 [Thozetella sp. PMI_491]|nr:hypothetical protein GQ53DRAFT_753276 [Thozetella sp. PMI_491]
MSTDAPPPPYTPQDVLATGPTSPASAYIQTRPVQGNPRTELIEHKLPLIAADSKLPFPEPEQAWLGRDVTHHDWDTFVSQLGPIPHGDDTTEAKSSFQTRAKGIVGEWNDGFFNPRGLNVEPVFAGASESKGFGFKLGNSFVGVSLGENAHGVGLKLPGVLVGISSASEDKKEGGQ